MHLQARYATGDAAKLPALAAQLLASGLDVLVAVGTEATQAARQSTVRLAGSYTGRILSGAHPRELPVQQSSRVELVINLRTAKRCISPVKAVLPD